MPDSEFLEKHQLYRKFDFQFSKPLLEKIEKVNINMHCSKCQNMRTFNMTNNYSTFLDGNLTYRIQFKSQPLYSGYNLIPKEGLVTWLTYKCASCNTFTRHFFIEMNSNDNFIRKVGQLPPWDIQPDKELQSILGDYIGYYKNGLICESQGYGIGAYAYYRRIIEEIIDSLLEQIGSLIEQGENIQYMEALERTKQTNITQEKIKLVYDLLPPILNPEEFNPLKTLHQVLSEGVHGRSDDACLKDAEVLRETTLFLVKAVLRSIKEKKEFTDKMRKLLERQRQNKSNQRE